jgi:carbon starvation protein
MVFWNLFGASNQLLAALTLLGVTVWLWRTTKRTWVLFVTGLPCVFMYVMSMWALILEMRPLLAAAGLAASRSGEQVSLSNPVPWVASLLAALGALMLLEAAWILWQSWNRPPAANAGTVPAMS